MAKNKGQAGKKGADAADQTIENRRARYDYAILDTIEAGMVLRGSEVKSIRDGKVSLAEGYVRVETGLAKPQPAKKTAGKKGPEKPARRPSEPGLYLHSVNIAEYPPAGPTGSVAQHAPTRTRKLLVHHKEIERLAREVEVKGMTLVPLKIYFKNGKAKCLVGLGRGKTHEDKRESIAKREADRDMQRAMSRRG